MHKEHFYKDLIDHVFFIKRKVQISFITCYDGSSLSQRPRTIQKVISFLFSYKHNIPTLEKKKNIITIFYLY